MSKTRFVHCVAGREFTRESEHPYTHVVVGHEDIVRARARFAPETVCAWEAEGRFDAHVLAWSSSERLARKAAQRFTNPRFADVTVDRISGAPSATTEGGQG